MEAWGSAAGLAAVVTVAVIHCTVVVIQSCTGGRNTAREFREAQTTARLKCIFKKIQQIVTQSCLGLDGTASGDISKKQLEVMIGTEVTSVFPCSNLRVSVSEDSVMMRREEYFKNQKLSLVVAGM